MKVILLSNPALALSRLGNSVVLHDLLKSSLNPCASSSLPDSGVYHVCLDAMLKGRDERLITDELKMRNDCTSKPWQHHKVPCWSVLPLHLKIIPLQHFWLNHGIMEDSQQFLLALCGEEQHNRTFAKKTPPHTVATSVKLSQLVSQRWTFWT